MMNSAIKELQDLLGPTVGEAMTTTGRVLTMPSNIGLAKAVKAVRDMPLDATMRAFAGVLARDIGAELAGVQLRPADYAEVDDLLQTIMARLIDEVQEHPAAFAKELSDRLKEQG